jgi:hypothetical protein
VSTIATAKEQKERKVVSAGMHPATCIWVVDMGLQHNNYSDNDQYKVYLQFEVDETIKIDGADKPMVIGNKYTLSLHEKSNLRKVLEGWRGKPFTEEDEKGFDIKSFLGIPCILNVTHNVKDGTTYANIASINPVMKGVTVEPPKNELIHFDMDDPGREEVLKKLPNWIQEKITNSITYLKTVNSMFEPIDPDDEQMPF